MTKKQSPTILTEGTAMLSHFLIKWLCPLLLLVATTAAAQHEHGDQHDDATTQHQHGDQYDDDATARHTFEDAQSWAGHFEDPERDSWQLPDSIVAKLVGRDDLVIVDIGSATGYFPVRFARACPKGQVIGADVEPDMVWYLNERSRREELPNLISVLAAPDDPHLPVKVDLVFLCNTYHHIDNRVDYFTRLKNQMKPNGRVAVVDFRRSSHRGPPHKLDRDDIVSELNDAGYTLVESFDFLPDQHFLVFENRSGD
jgi:SAM-dependent methyltransferase